MIKDKAFYREFFNLYVMLVLQNVIVLGVNLADNIMIGSYSETSLEVFFFARNIINISFSMHLAA